MSWMRTKCIENTMSPSRSMLWPELRADPRPSFAVVGALKLAMWIQFLGPKVFQKKMNKEERCLKQRSLDTYGAWNRDPWIPFVVGVWLAQARFIWWRSIMNRMGPFVPLDFIVVVIVVTEIIWWEGWPTVTRNKYVWLPNGSRCSSLPLLGRKVEVNNRIHDREWIGIVTIQKLHERSLSYTGKPKRVQ